MPATYRIEFAARTDTGLVREQNEDAIFVSEEHRFAILADGMGGHNAGEVASQLAVDAARRSLESSLAEFDLEGQLSECQAQVREAARNAFHAANAAVVQAARLRPELRGMGTTFSAVVFRPNYAQIIHVGDSRAYRFRDDKLTLLTRDHTLVQEQVDAGLIPAELAAHARHRNLLTRAIGMSDDLEPDLVVAEVRDGDVFLLCSDGLTDMISTEQIEQSIVQAAPALAARCDALVDASIRQGGFDNVSLILARK